MGSRTLGARSALALALCLPQGFVAPRPAQAQTAPPARRPFLVVLAGPRGAQQLARVGAGAQLERLALRFDRYTHEYPMVPRAAALSPDGARLAFLRDGRPLVRELATGAEAPLVTGRVRDAEVRFVGFAPDGARVAYTLVAQSTMDGPEPRLPAPAGVYVAAVSAEPAPRARPPVALRVRTERVANAQPDEVAYWTADGGGLFARHHVAQYQESLLRVPLDGSAVMVLHTLRGFDGFSQLHARAAGFVFATSAVAANGARGAMSLAWLGPVGQTAAGLRTLAPLAELNPDPQLSPDGAEVAYFETPANQPAALWVLRADGSGMPRRLYSCDRCRYRWESPSSVLVVHGSGLLRVHTTGAATETLVPSGVDAVLVADAP